jgi:hypothetical protein
LEVFEETLEDVSKKLNSEQRRKKLGYGWVKERRYMKEGTT